MRCVIFKRKQPGAGVHTVKYYHAATGGLGPSEAKRLVYVVKRRARTPYGNTPIGGLLLAVRGLVHAWFLRQANLYFPFLFPKGREIVLCAGLLIHSRKTGYSSYAIYHTAPRQLCVAQRNSCVASVKMYTTLHERCSAGRLANGRPCRDGTPPRPRNVKPQHDRFYSAMSLTT